VKGVSIVVLACCDACRTVPEHAQRAYQVPIKTTEAAKVAVLPGIWHDAPATLTLRRGDPVHVYPRALFRSNRPGRLEAPPHLLYLYDGEPSLQFEREGNKWWRLDPGASRERVLVGIDAYTDAWFKELAELVNAGRADRYLWVLLRNIRGGDVPVLGRVESLGIQLDTFGDTDFRRLAGLGNLRALRVNTTLSADQLRGLERLTSLTHLSIGLKNSETAVPGPVVTLTSLVSLDLSYATTLTDLSGLSRLPRLRNLSVYGERCLMNIKPLSRIQSLRNLALFNCRGLEGLRPLAGLCDIETLSLAYGVALRDIQPLSGLSSLRELDLTGCGGVSGSQIDALQAKLPGAVIVTKRSGL
jgi:hypothetical protein